jgi:hypothetical protein
MPWWQFALLGTGGGLIVEVLAIFRCVAAWQEAHRNLGGTLKNTPPKLGRYVDVPAYAIMLPARAVLGAAAATLFGTTGQVTGIYGAVAFGCAAPVLLAQLGLIPQVERALNKDHPSAEKPKGGNLPLCQLMFPLKKVICHDRFAASPGASPTARGESQILDRTTCTRWILGRSSGACGPCRRALGGTLPADATCPSRSTQRQHRPQCYSGASPGQAGNGGRDDYGH